MTPDKNSVNHDDPKTNMYGCYPCPMCLSRHRWPTNKDNKHPNSILCNDCGHVTPIVNMPEEQH